LQHRLSLFDFDKTIVVCDTLLPFLLATSGAFRVLTALTHLLYRAPGFLFSETTRRVRSKELLLEATLKGRTPESLPLNEFAELVLRHAVNPRVIKTLRSALSSGERVVMISASIRAYLEPIARRLGIELIATEIELSPDGLITGKISGANCRGEEKVIRLGNLLNPAEYQVISAYGDSSGDREMLQLATNPHFRFGRGYFYPLTALFKTLRLYLACLSYFYRRRLPPA
jgi:HAD superfamily hydrolase (TIGR01490 family)